LLVREGTPHPSAAQPGGREPAPGRLALVQAFANTFYDLTPGRHGADVLCSPAALRTWLAQNGLISPAARLDDHDLERALALRDALRSWLQATTHLGSGPESAAALGRVDELARGATVEVRLEPSGPRFVTPDETSIDGAIGVVVATVATAMTDGTWWRMKLCPGRDCGWAFYDHSRNQTSRWCSMAVCGGRAKARSHYRRHRGEAR
jgi:predicted RNA-binding Zn ribbon-like protein